MKVILFPKRKLYPIHSTITLFLLVTSLPAIFGLQVTCSQSIYLKPKIAVSDLSLRKFRQLKNGRASCLESMSNKFLEIAKETIAPSLCDIINCSIKSKIYPHDFKIAIVTPIFKGDETDDLENYRPISVLSTVARIFEKILYNQLYDYLTKHNILEDKQWGFRSLHSTALALIGCSNNWLVNIDREGINTTVLLDIKKAFDTIDHEILLTKLDYYGIKNDKLHFLKSYLNKRQQSCKVNNHTSRLKEIILGVPQGSILGPLLSLFLWMTYLTVLKMPMLQCMQMILVLLQQ